MTKKIKFITGLSNWGKTTCIQKLLDAGGSFQSTYKSNYKTFSVGSKKAMTLQFSNCDLGLERYINELGMLLEQYESKDDVDFVLVALCCSSVDDISKVLSFVEGREIFEVELVFLEKHWDGVATLCVDDMCKRLEDMNYRFSKMVLESSGVCGSGVI
ncbi:MAG: hypothetical protein IBX44_02750 [Sulfurospirillum sp.]|nr:hypothetical protein [Sulfurospirillum sp.]